MFPRDERRSQNSDVRRREISLGIQCRKTIGQAARVVAGHAGDAG